MKTLLALSTLLLMSRCIPNRLVPHDFSIEKNNLEAYVEMDSITISLVNLEVKNDHFVFGIGVHNQSSKPIFINADKIEKQAYSISHRQAHSISDKRTRSIPHKNEGTEEYYREIVTAMSPRQVKDFFKAKKNNAEAAAAFLFLLGAAISTYDLVQDVKDNKKEYWTEKDEKKSASRDLVVSSTLAATDILTDVAFTSQEKFHLELKYLPGELFNRTTIYPGEEYYGKILFKKVAPLQEYHRVNCPIEGNNMIFDFRKANLKERQFLFEQGQ